jgi:hypothetical protein
LEKTEKAMSSSDDKQKRKTRSETDYFDYSTMCILCEQVCQQGHKHKMKRRKVEMSRTGLSLAEIIADRCNHDVANEVHGRLTFCNDLVAADSVYHYKCYLRFKRRLPKAKGVLKTGRPIDVDREVAFTELCRELDRSRDNGLYTLDDLHMMMKNLMGLNCNGQGADDDEDDYDCSEDDADEAISDNDGYEGQHDKRNLPYCKL